MSSLPASAMYSTCIFCGYALGSHESIATFPVGRRLAFDATRGWFWVVCPECERWSLSPLEERWEAIEQCERRFRDTRLRVSTDGVGPARLREGLELVRAAAPGDGRPRGAGAAGARREPAALEAAWREAEEIAAILDTLLEPSGFDECLRRLCG